MAEQITINSKTHRPGVCNALETLLVHRAFAKTHLKDLIKALKEKGVIIKGCEKTAKIAGDIEKATEDDWHAEYLDLRLSVRVVENLEEAMDHIECYGSKHTETIVTSDYANGRKFLSAVDSSVVLINASTRFNDGGQLGLGAEIGISTSKIHSFGPMGLEELTTKKFIVFGEGQIRE
jgi:glutamate-5-semialdehyde dehydrogenase